MNKVIFVYKSVIQISLLNLPIFSFLKYHLAGIIAYAFLFLQAFSHKVENSSEYLLGPYISQGPEDFLLNA